MPPPKRTAPPERTVMGVEPAVEKAERNSNGAEGTNGVLHQKGGRKREQKGNVFQSFKSWVRSFRR